MSVATASAIAKTETDQSNASAEPPPVATNTADRVVAIDALRGFDMFWITGGKPWILAMAAALVGSKEPPPWLKTQLEHTHWVGFSCYDLIMPLFLFIVGASMPFSFAKYRQLGVPNRVIYQRMAWRFTLLWLFGMLVQGNLLKLEWAIFRPATNVLQAIAFGYVVTGLVLLHVPRRSRVFITAALLIVYWLLMILVPVPGIGVGVLDEDRNLATWIDLQILGSHAYHHTVPGGYTTHYAYILTMLPFSATVMIGMHAGEWLRSAHSPLRKLLGLVLAGLGCLAAGWVWSFSFPIIKPIFTSSMVLWASGWSLLLLALFYALTDMMKWRAWAFPFVVIGANALFAYLATHLFGAQISGMSGHLFTGLAKHLEPTVPASVVWSTGYVLIVWLMCWFLYRNKLFWRV